MEYLIQYGMFFAKVATIVVAIIIVLGAIVASGSRQKKIGRKGTIRVTPLNDHFDDMREILRHSVLDKNQLKKIHKQEKTKIYIIPDIFCGNSVSNTTGSCNPD